MEVAAIMFAGTFIGMGLMYVSWAIRETGASRRSPDLHNLEKTLKKISNDWLFFEKNRITPRHRN